MKIPVLALAVGVSLIGSATAEAQRTKSSSEEPCCSITAIEWGIRVATASDKAGKSFKFEFRDPAVTTNLVQIGRKVFADFVTRKVSFDGVQFCCAILTNVFDRRDASTGLAADVAFSSAISDVDAATGIVTARELATGRVFRFEVRDSTLLRSLKVGQKIAADFGTSKVRISGDKPCCNIIGHGVKN